MTDDKRLKNLKPWKPGDPSPNPAGRPPTSPEIKKMRKLTQEQLEEIGDLILFGTRTDLVDMLERDDTTIIKLWIGKIILRAIDEKDPDAVATLEALLKRFIGNVASVGKLDVTGNMHTTLVDMIKRFEGEG